MILWDFKIDDSRESDKIGLGCIVVSVQDDTQSVETIAVEKQAVTQASCIAIAEAMANKNNTLQISIEATGSESAEKIGRGGAITVVLLEDI